MLRVHRQAGPLGGRGRRRRDPGGPHIGRRLALSVFVLGLAMAGGELGAIRGTSLPGRVVQGAAALADGAAVSRLHVKFRSGTSLEDPGALFPSELRSQIDRIEPLFTLDEAGRRRIGAERMRLWYLLVLSADVDATRLIEELSRLDVIDAVERVPAPAPPPRPE